MTAYKQPPTTFAELIAPFPAVVRESATTLRTLILEAMPEAHEHVSGGLRFGTALYSLGQPMNVACGVQPGDRRHRRPRRTSWRSIDEMEYFVEPEEAFT